MATAPTAAEIRDWSQVDFAARGYVLADPDPLQRVVDEALSEVTLITARRYEDNPPPVVKTVLDQVVRMFTEQIVMQGQEDNVETAGDFDMIGSFSAGSYSETRRNPITGAGPRPLNPWPALEQKLWLLMTLAPGEINDNVLAQFDYWRYLLGYATVPPAWSVVEVDWRTGGAVGSGAYGVVASPWNI